MWLCKSEVLKPAALQTQKIAKAVQGMANKTAGSDSKTKSGGEGGFRPD